MTQERLSDLGFLGIDRERFKTLQKCHWS